MSSTNGCPVALPGRSALWMCSRLTVALIAALVARRAPAACNLIPGTTNTFDAALGATNRPFAAPGEPVDVRLRPCDASPGLTTTDPTQYIVSVIFEPTGFGSKNAVVLTGAADCSAVSPLLGTCEGQLGGGSAVATCVSGAAAGMQVVDINVDNTVVRYLRFLFPDTDSFVGTASDDHTLAGPATIVVTAAPPASLPCDLATTTCKGHAPGLIACIDDFFANDAGACGTTARATTFGSFTALPPPNDYQGDCFADVGPCTANFGTPNSDLRLVSDKAGNLLLPMNWQGILVRENNVPVPRLLRATIRTGFSVVFPGQSFFASYTPEGGLLPPIFEPQYDRSSPAGQITAFGSADAPYTILRAARRSAVFRQCSGGVNNALPCTAAGDCPGACSGGSTPGARCTADADCSGGGMCGPAGTCGATTCHGGGHNGRSCTSDLNCPGGECGPSLFDFRIFGESGNGALIIAQQGVLTHFCQSDEQQTCATPSDPVCGANGPCVAYALEAKVPVNLEGLAQSSDTFAFSVKESVAGKDLNGDDAMPPYTDTVVTLTDRTTGKTQALGTPAGCGIAGTPEGRAIIRQQQPPFSFPAVATEGDTIAFLESEAGENSCNENGDGDASDSILRVFRLGPMEIAPGLSIPADGALEINSRSLAMSNGRVFFRAPEVAQATRATVRASEFAGGGEAASFGEFGLFALGRPISAGGRDVVFDSDDGGYYGGGPGLRQIIVKNLVTGTTELISKTAANIAGNGQSDEASISADGRFVVFSTFANNLISGDATNDCTQPFTLNCGDILLYDRCVANGMPVSNCPANPVDRMELISQSTAGVHGNNHSREPEVSADGRFVAFASAANNLEDNANDTNICSSNFDVLGAVGPCPDIFVRDRCNSNGDPVPSCTPTTKRVSVWTDGTQGNQQMFNPSISDDGQRVVFTTAAQLHADDGGGQNDVYVHDLRTGITDLASRTTTGAHANGISEFGSISGNGRYVGFESTGDFIVADDSNGRDDAFVRDLLEQRTERVSVTWDGSVNNGDSGIPSLSRDGRFVVFLGAATNLVPGDTNGFYDWFVRDRVTGVTERITLANSGAQSNANTSQAYISPDGHWVAFQSVATNLVASDGNGVVDIFVRGVNRSDTLSDTTGDGDLDDTVLEMLDTAAMSPTPVPICPATQVSVAGGAAAFLRPETAGNAPNLSLCPAGADLNNDGDTDDNVVVFTASLTLPAQNLDRAATAVTLSAICTGGENAGKSCTANADCPQSACNPTYVAALVSEAGEETDLNGDGDQNDDVVEIHNLSDMATVWTNTGQAADALKASGDLVAFTTPETAQQDRLNGDNDKVDRVLQIYDAGSGKVTNTHEPAEDFVIGAATGPCGDSPLVAFRTREASMCGTAVNGGNCAPPNLPAGCALDACDLNHDGDCCDSGEAAMCGTFVDSTNCTPPNLPPSCSLNTCDLNGDGDCCDDVLQVYARSLGVINTKQAVTPCFFEACDPLVPYRVNQNKVKFITFEAAQGAQDLNGNGNSGDLVLQQFEACSGQVTVEGTLDPGGAGADDALIDPQPTQPGGGKTIISPAGKCRQGTSELLVPPTCAHDDDCPTGYMCQTGDLVVAAPAVVPHHDTVLQPTKPLSATIRSGAMSVSKSFKITVRNADILPVREQPGHTMRLSVGDGTCPVGTVVGFPDFDDDTPGAQDTIAVAGGKSAVAMVSLFIDAAQFTTFNAKSPSRCVLEARADADVLGNEDPSPSNNMQPIELNVIDGHDPEQSSGTMNDHESVAVSAKAIKLTIASHQLTATKTVRVKVGNADILPSPEVAGHAITLSVTGGDCPSGALDLPQTLTVSGGSVAAIGVNVTAAANTFKAAGLKSPGRCVAELTASGPMGNAEPNATNNTTRLVVDVVDKNDF